MVASRESETRAKNERPAKWRPPEMLPTPNPIPGYVFRWVRCATMGEPDPTNISSKRREGWEFVRAEDHPELMIPSSNTGKYAGLVENGGLVLAKIPEEFMRDRTAYYEGVSNEQIRSVDNTFFKENHPAMKMFKEGDSRVAVGFGNGRSK